MSAAGIHDHDRYKLGLVPHDKGVDQLLQVRWKLDPATIAPREVDHSNITPGLDGNNQYGDCGPCSAANIERTVSKYETGTQADPTLGEVYGLYSHCTQPPFNPSNGANDNGVTNPDLYSAWLHDGLGSTEKPVAYGQLEDLSDASIALALDVFGAATLAIDLQTAQQAQSDQPNPTWDYSKSAEWGGHDVCIHSIKDGIVYCWSWAMLIGMTPEFRKHQATEIFVPVFPSVIASDAFDATVNVDAMRSDFLNLTGKQLPVPGPAPTPSPAPPSPQPGGGASFLVDDPQVVAEVARLAQREGVTSTAWANNALRHRLHIH